MIEFSSAGDGITAEQQFAAVIPGERSETGDPRLPISEGGGSWVPARLALLAVRDDSRACGPPLSRLLLRHEIEHRVGKAVVRVPRHHVACFGHVDVVRMRHEIEKFPHMRLLHELG